MKAGMDGRVKPGHDDVAGGMPQISVLRVRTSFAM
jgi:hypothetical protein